ncbi:MAG: hypothetical protein R3F15_18345 [Lysobacterales bacterium]
MSIVHMRQIGAFLEANYRQIVDVSDAPQGCAEDYFRTRSLAAYAIKTLAEIPFDASAAAIVDGYGDNGIDALYYSSSERLLYLVQSKWK